MFQYRFYLHFYPKTMFLQYFFVCGSWDWSSLNNKYFNTISPPDGINKCQKKPEFEPALYQ